MFTRVLGNFQRMGQSRTHNMLEEEEKINKLKDREKSMRQLGSEDLVTMVQVDKETWLFKFTSKEETERMMIRSSMLYKTGSMLQSEGILTTVALQMKNWHKFSPDQGLTDMRVQDVALDKETKQKSKYSTISKAV